jgi:hypothetical protein
VWAIDNRTPFAAERAGARDRNGAELWLVAVKATFQMMDDGSLELAGDQEPVHLAPAFRDDAMNSSLLHDTDLVWGKPGTDVLLQGSAWSCTGLVTELPVAFQVGPVTRQAVVVGERLWERAPGGVMVGATRPFTTAPLCWEHAFGGTDPTVQPAALEPRNPVGRGFSYRRVQPPGNPLPTIEHPRERLGSPADRPPPVGFGPVACHWHERARWAGTYDETWMQQRRPLSPDDFDLRHQFSAPAGQQVPGHLRGGEDIRLANLHPRLPRYRCRLPQVDLRFRTVFRGAAPVHHHGKLSSVTIDTDRALVIVAWIAELPCHHTIQRLLRTEIRTARRVRVKAAGVPMPS